MINDLQLPCTTLTITTDKTSTYVGDIITLTINTEPIGSHTVILRDQYDNFIGSCDTNAVDGTCIINWNTEGLSSGLYTLIAAIGTQCFNPIPTTIMLSSYTMPAPIAPTPSIPEHAGMIIMAGLLIGILYLGTRHNRFAK